MKLVTSKFCLVVLAFSLFSVITQGQEYSMKYGKIDPANLEMVSYEKDTSVVAMVIGDFGDVRFSYISGSFQVVFDRHIRIKIFKKEGYSWADHMIRLYSSGGSEKMGSMSGTTYNMVNGKIEKTKLSNKSVFKEEESDNYQTVKFTMPEVREGSILEYKYTIMSKLKYNLPEWQFQRSIPVLWSEYNAIVPEYYFYKQIMTGYEALAVSDIKTTGGSITIDPKTNNTVNFINNVYKMVAIDVPPFITEPMLTTTKNYILKVKFEISSENFPGRPSVIHSESWESINNKLVERDDFYGQLSGGNFLSDAIDEINLSTTDSYERIKACYEYIKGHMKWNDYYSKYISTTLRNAYNEQSGNSGDINLMLVMMLQKAGFKANPVILSTRSNGIINPYFPLTSVFNYVIARVENDGKVYLLDATDPLANFNVLPVRCLNGQGRIIDEAYTDWQDLSPVGSYDYKCDMKLILDSDGDFSGSFVNDRSDYAAFRLRKMIKDEKSEEDFIEKIENNNSGLEIESYEFVDLDDVYKPVKEIYEVKIVGESDVAGDLIYFNPMFYEQVKSNPFKLEDRMYPIDFAYPMNEVFTLTIEIPEGYSVEELPKNTTLTLPNNSAEFKFQISHEGGVIKLRNEFHITKPVFVYNEYASLKEFYDQMVKKHTEMVVLKKSATSN